MSVLDTWHFYIISPDDITSMNLNEGVDQQSSA